MDDDVLCWMTIQHYCNIFTVYISFLQHFTIIYACVWSFLWAVGAYALFCEGGLASVSIPITGRTSGSRACRAVLVGEFTLKSLIPVKMRGSSYTNVLARHKT